MGSGIRFWRFVVAKGIVRHKQAARNRQRSKEDEREK